MDPARSSRLVRRAIGAIAAALAAWHFVPPLLDARGERRQQADVAHRFEVMAREFEACVLGDSEPSQSGERILERLATERAFLLEYRDCNHRHGASITALRKEAASSTQREALDSAAAQARLAIEDVNPGLHAVCGRLLEVRRERAMMSSEAGGDAELSCPSYAELDDLEAATALTPELEWDLQYLDAEGTALAVLGGQRLSLVARFRPFGSTNVSCAFGDTYDARGYFWDEDGAVVLFGHGDPSWIEVCAGKPHAELRHTFRDEVHGLWVTGTRWFAAVEEGGRRGGPPTLGIQVSDDRGRSWRRVDPDTPVAAPGRFRLTAHPTDEGIVILGASRWERGGPTKFVVFHISGRDQLHTSQLELDTVEDLIPRLQACAGETATYAVVDGEYLIVVPPDGEPHVADTFEGDARLEPDGLSLTCTGDKAVVYARRATQPNTRPSLSGVATSGAPLFRYECSEDGCDDRTLVAEGALRWDVRATDHGTRAMVELFVLSGSVLGVVDEPPGGPIERRELLRPEYSAAGVVVWRETAFVTNAPQSSTAVWF